MLNVLAEKHEDRIGHSNILCNFFGRYARRYFLLQLFKMRFYFRSREGLQNIALKEWWMEMARRLAIQEIRPELPMPVLEAAG